MDLNVNLCHTPSDERNDETEINISDAVKEILTLIMEKSLGRTEKLYLSVNVKSTKQDPSNVTWFYVKVSTSCEIKRENFKGNRFADLFELLEKLQCMESASHLCLHYPRSDGQPGSTQDNIMLVDHKLCTIEQVHKPKHTSYSTIYLRVHQKLWQMSEECGKVHTFMLLSKVFRPKDELSFSMKLGEVLSDTDFSSMKSGLEKYFLKKIFPRDGKCHPRYRAKWCRKVSPEMPEVVTDSSFYMKESSLDSCRSLNLEPSVSPPHIVKKICLKPNGEPIQTILKLQEIGLCFPCEGPQGVMSSYINVTVFGPTFLPYKGHCSSLNALIDIIDWSQFGLKFISSASMARNHSPRGHFHGVLKHKKSCLMDRVHIEVLLVAHADRQSDVYCSETVIETAIDESKSEVVKNLENILKQVLQPVLLKAKTRNLMYRSIRSVCKGVTDIVSMSSSDGFHSKVLEIMKVPDTIELGKTLETRLKAINARRHAGIWAGSNLSDHVDNEPGTQSEDQIVPSNSILLGENTLNCSQRQPAKTYTNTEVGLQGDTGLKDGQFEREMITSPSIKTAVNITELTINKSDGTRPFCDGKHAMSPFNELAVGEDEDFGVELTPETTQLKQCSTVNRNSISDARTKYLTDGKLVMSPFNELALGEDDEQFGNKTPEVTTQTYRFPVNEWDRKAVSDAFVQVPQVQQAMSPFNELAVGEGEDLYIDKTPEITQLTKNFKEVSPFQEFAATDVDTIKDILGEDPFKDSTGEIDELIPARNKKDGGDNVFKLNSAEILDTVCTDGTMSPEYHSYVKYPRREAQAGMTTGVHTNSSQRTNSLNHNIDSVNQGDPTIKRRMCHNNQCIAVNEQYRSNKHKTDASFNEGAVSLQQDKQVSIERKSEGCSFFDRSVLLNEEKQVDDLDEDSEDWFNDVLVGIEHWLK